MLICDAKYASCHRLMQTYRAVNCGQIMTIVVERRHTACLSQIKRHKKHVIKHDEQLVSSPRILGV